MRLTTQSISDEITIQKRMKEKIQNMYLDSKEYEDFHLAISKQKKGINYYTFSDPKLKKKQYIGHKTDFVQKVQAAHLKREYLTRIDANLVALEVLLKVFKPVGLSDVIGDLPKAYQDLDTSDFITADDRAKKWLTQMTEFKKQHPNPLPITDGTPINSEITVRSKTEAFIYKRLTELGIPFIYECPVYVEGEWYWPDFTIFLNGKTFYWEHLGDLYEEKYFRKYFYRFLSFGGEGLYLQEQVFITVELPGGRINLITIDNTIRSIIALAGLDPAEFM